MSGTPNKRLHEESSGSAGGARGHSSATKFPQYDSIPYSSVGPKLMSSTMSEYHGAPFDVGQEARMLNVSRVDSRDVDRKSPLLPMYRTSSSSNDSHPDHPSVSENRLDARDSKDNSRDLKVDNRDTKAESRELYQGIKRDKDMRSDGRGDDNKETKYERDTYSDPEYKRDLKTEKDVYGSVSNQLIWKDPKEHHKGKKYPDAQGGNADPWHTSRPTLYGTVEVAKGAATEERDYVEGHEVVGEKKFDLKSDDKFKDKDRKRKDGKHREWGERDRRSNLQVGNGSGDGKDSTREEREAERWEKERKDLFKDKEKPKEREKDHVKREGWNGIEKEGSHSEKELTDVSGRILEQENSTFEQKKPKDHDSWKNVDKEARERRKERDGEVDGERPEKRSRCYDKELEDGGVGADADADGGAEREREAFNYGVQQRKRMLRPRGSPQMANREPRLRSRAQDSEGSQGKPEVSTVIYGVGECMQELLKLWKEFECSQGDKNGESSQNGPTLEIRIPAEHVTATNRQVRGGQLWGTDIYTDDSDLVAVLMHTGYCRPTASPPPPAIEELRATIRVLPPQDCYVSKLRNNVRSRSWGAAIGCSYRVERCCIVKKGGGTMDLEPCLTHTSSVEPTLAPVAVERTMTTRSAASNALRQQRFVREVTIQYNLCNEPWIKYSISIVADKGLKKALYTSARLKKGEVLYLETHLCRYELCFSGEKMIKAMTVSQSHETDTEKSQHHNFHSTNSEKSAMDVDYITLDVFRWSRCKKPLPQKVMRSIGIPLPLEHLEVLEENLDWEDIQWSQTGVWIAGKEYPLARVHFLSPS